ncbi:hypothetical protein EB796_015723 [Bugula neritina]|uniref:Uncharacterized protein n=1 Tax=Bugula neritina TaxID=10212 RepID=A0A7J7JIS7_BUGNE|nr:hypothetical protein EB796_015723 [Bugula neritina]
MRLAYKVVVNEHKHNNSSVSNYNCVTTQSGCGALRRLTKQVVGLYGVSTKQVVGLYGVSTKQVARTKAQEEKLEELDAKARNLEQEVETQRHLVNSKGKEVERLQSLLELTEAKHENAQRQLESKLRIELELRVSQAKDDALKRMADNEISLQQAHQRQLADVVSDHNRQLGAMRERYSNELSRVKTQFEDQVKTAESALGDAKQELEEAWTQKEAAESQREDLTSRLQAVLSLLGTVGTQATSSSKSMSHIRPSSRPSSRNSSNLLRTTTLHPQPPVYVDAFNSPKSLKTPDMDLSPNAPTRPPAPQTSNDHVYTFSSEAPRVTSNTDTSSEYIDTPQPSEPKSTGKMIEEPRQGPEHHQLYQSGQHKPECQVDDEKDHDDSGSVVSTTETFEIGENDSQYRHRRQAELQDYIKKLLNRSVGDPLIETRIDLDESHISVISGIQEHSVILHDANHSPKKKAFQQEVLQHDHTPPVKGSSKKVNPKEIASLITKYGGESKTPSTSEYLEYLKTVAVNNHTGFLKDFVNSSTLRKAAAPAAATKRDLTDSFNAPTHKPSAGNSRVKPSTPEKSTLSRQAKGKDKTKVKRHSSSRSQAVWK